MLFLAPICSIYLHKSYGTHYISYVAQFKKYDLKDEVLNNLKIISENCLAQNINDVFFFEKNKDFVKYNYFTKLDDCAKEREYRYLAYGQDDFFVSNISDALVGVIIGEKIKSTDEKIIKLFCKNM